MRFITFAAVAFAVFQSTSALPVSKYSNDLTTRDDRIYTREVQILEARGKDHKDSHKPAPPTGPHITFLKGHGPEHAHSASNHLDALNLHGKKRKEVEDYHKHVVADHMQGVPQSHSAVVKNLAHSMGSRDPHIHISAGIHDKQGQIIEAPRRGNPAIMDPTHHIYVNKEHPEKGYESLPKTYTKAVDKKLVREGKQPGRA